MSRSRASAVPHGAGVSQASLRAQNLAVVTASLFAGGRPVSRADLAAATGLTRSTVSRLVGELVAARILTELVPETVGRRGRPATPLAPAAGTLAGLGLEVSGHHLVGRVVDLTGAVLAEQVVPGRFERSQPGPVLARVGRLACSLLSDPACAGVTLAGASLALPGLVEHGSGRLLRAPNLDWTEIRPAELIGTDVLPAGVELVVSNEADLAALAQSLRAPGRPAPGRTFFYVSGDIGIGAATVVDGVLAQGVRGWAGEIGHTLVDPAGPVCGCGARGCLEQYAGRDVLLAAAGLPAGTTAQVLAEAALAGGAAAEAVERAGWALGIALANAVNLLDVPDIVLGAGFLPLFDLLAPAAQEQLRARVLAWPWSPATLRPAGTGTFPAATGGALAALGSVIAAPAEWVPSAG